MTKIKLITMIMGLCLIFITSHAHSAGEPKTVTYYMAVNGKFQERLKWVMNNGEEWNRFEAFTSRFRNGTQTFSPIDKNATQLTPDMIVISDQNKNLGTGRDYYLTKHGVTIAERAPKHRFFRDNKNFYGFLKEQVGSYLQYQTKPTGLRIIYQIGNELVNPSWIISKSKDLSIYYDFLKDNQEIKDNSKSLQNMNKLFDQKNTFLVQILSKPSEYDVVAIAPDYLRFSKPTVTYRHLIDEKNYYQFYKSRALDNLKNDLKNKKNDLKNKKNDREKLKSQF